MSSWHPIETAPKDGTRVLIYIPDNAPSADGFYRTTGFVVAKFQSHWEGWSMPGIAGLFPTHWMPLPSPPERRSTE